MIRINDTTTLPEDELILTATRSSGPGGQNVNKVATRVTLRFDLAASDHLTPLQKSRVRRKLKSHITKEGELVLHEETQRSQAANRRLVIEKFAALIAAALVVPKKRIPTKVSAGQKKRRVDEKKQQGKKKDARKKLIDF